MRFLTAGAPNFPRNNQSRDNPSAGTLRRICHAQPLGGTRMRIKLLSTAALLVAITTLLASSGALAQIPGSHVVIQGKIQRLSKKAGFLGTWLVGGKAIHV